MANHRMRRWSGMRPWGDPEHSGGVLVDPSAKRADHAFQRLAFEQSIASGQILESRQMTTPRPYAEWRQDPVQRWRDAFHTFGHLLFTHTLNSVIADLPQSTSPEARVVATKAASDALYSVMRILEGTIGVPADEDHTIEFALIARVLRSESPHDCVEQFELAPNGEESASNGIRLWSDGNFLE